MSDSGSSRIVWRSLWTRSALVALLSALITAGCGGEPSAVPTANPRSPTPVAGRDLTGSLSVGSHNRTYLLHLPPDATRLRPTPIILAFHGAGQSSRQLADVTGLGALADAHGFAVLLPDGYERTWAVPLDDSPAEQAGIDDVAFVRRLLEAVSSQYDLDASHVIAAGLSAGAAFAQFLGCSAADRLIGVVASAGPLPRGTAASCKPARKISVILMHGTEDPIVSYDGSAGDSGTLSLVESLALWAQIDGCQSTPASAALPDTAHDGTTVTELTFGGCTAGTEVSGYSVKGGGHAWPGGEPIAPADMVGRTTKQIDASKLAWSLLDRHR